MGVADAGLRSEPVVGVPGFMVPPIKGIEGSLGLFPHSPYRPGDLYTWEASTRNKLLDPGL